MRTFGDVENLDPPDPDAFFGMMQAKRKKCWKGGLEHHGFRYVIQTGMTVMTGGLQGGSEQAPVSLFRRVGSGNCRG